MPTPWIDMVRTSGHLRVYLDRSLGTGWRRVVTDAIRTFNRIASREHLGVQFAEETATPEVFRGADVGVYAIDGQSSFRFQDTRYTVSLSGSLMHGETKLVKYTGPLRVVKAFIYLPTNPLGNTPRGRRAAGVGVRSVIAFHELVHACGLSNADHGGAAFHGTPDFEYGRTAAGDRIAVGTGRDRILMPPLVLASDTCRLIRGNWTGVADSH